MSIKRFFQFLNEEHSKKVNHIEDDDIKIKSDPKLEDEVNMFMSSVGEICPRCSEKYKDCVCQEQDPWSTHTYHRVNKKTMLESSLKKQLMNYDEFLTEAKNSNNDVKVLVLSNISSKSYTIPALEKELIKRGSKFCIININTCKLEEKNDSSGDFLISDDKTKPFVINSDNTAILTRRGVIKNTVTRDIISKLEKNNFYVVNTLSSILACENKFTTSKILRDAGVPIPRMALIQNEKMIEAAVKEIGGKFPIILKMLSGSHGIGVSIIDTNESLKSVLQTMWKMDNELEVMIQEKIDADYDLRIHVLTKKFNSHNQSDTDSILLGAMQRNKIDNDFRTNYSLGGTVQKVKITPEQEKIAIDSARAIGCNWCGVDIIVDKNNGKNYVLEVNSSPGTQGLKKATGINVVTDIVDFILDKNNWIRSKMEVGFRELISIHDVCDVVAKFDTGNGSLSCSMTYDKMEIDSDDNINWILGKNKFKNKIIGYSNTAVGNDTHERPIIEIDIMFAGKLYKGVHVSLVPRESKSTPFLVNRKFMERIGCSVDPTREFMVTTSPKNYSPGSSQGDPHGGIKFKK
jgi:RimK family alpha-L-glutamate ligase